LQNQYKDKIQILVISSEPKQKVQSFIKKNKIAASVALPFVTDDRLLVKLFPHRIVPHQVWLAPGGKVLAITDAYYTQAKNIQAALDGKPLQLPLKKDFIGFDTKVSLLQNGNGGDENDIITRSLLTKYLSGLNSRTGMEAGNGSKRLYFINQPLLGLYYTAINKPLYNRIVLQVKDSTKYINYGNPWNEWAKNNAYSYEQQVPATFSREQCSAFMLQDLNRSLGLNGRIEKQLVKCWALVTTDTALLQTKGGKPLLQLYDQDHPFTTLQNQPLSKLVARANYQVQGMPLKPIIIDETNYTRHVDLELKTSLDDLPALKKELQRHGLDLIQVERELEMFVLSETHNNLP
jgi:hypothetical protein